MTKDYKSTTCVTFSDHQAVSLRASLRNEDFEVEEGFMPWDVNPNWRERREFGAKLAYAVGMFEIMNMARVEIILIFLLLTGMIIYLYL